MEPSKRNNAWNKANEVRGKDPEVWRRDKFGNLLRWGSYGTQGEFGWEVDHRFPRAKGGTDAPKNLQAIHWEENRKKSDKYPYEG